MSKARVLVVDDQEAIRFSLGKILEQHGFQVTTAGDVPEALGLIQINTYDVLLSDLHMPGAGDGLTVVSAMRHSNPLAVTMLLSAFPEMSAAANAILLQADEILVKPMKVDDLIAAIQQRLTAGPLHRRIVESVATILERTVPETIDDWYQRVEQDNLLTDIPMSREERVSHLPHVFADLVDRLQSFRPLGSKALISPSACDHGLNRRRHGYSAAMLVEESRLLQVTIFQTLQNNLGTIDFSVVLLGVMTIADEVDSQLSQAMHCYVRESTGDPLPAGARASLAA